MGVGVFVPEDVAKVSSHLELIQSYLVNWSLSSSQHPLLPHLLKFYYSAGKGTRDYGNVMSHIKCVVWSQLRQGDEAE